MRNGILHIGDLIKKVMFQHQNITPKSVADTVNILWCRSKEIQLHHNGIFRQCDTKCPKPYTRKTNGEAKNKGNPNIQR